MDASDELSELVFSSIRPAKDGKGVFAFDPVAIERVRQRLKEIGSGPPFHGQRTVPRASSQAIWSPRPAAGRWSWLRKVFDHDRHYR